MSLDCSDGLKTSRAWNHAKIKSLSQVDLAVSHIWKRSPWGSLRASSWNVLLYFFYYIFNAQCLFHIQHPPAVEFSTPVANHVVLWQASVLKLLSFVLFVAVIKTGGRCSSHIKSYFNFSDSEMCLEAKQLYLFSFVFLCVCLRFKELFLFVRFTKQPQLFPPLPLSGFQISPAESFSCKTTLAWKLMTWQSLTLKLWGALCLRELMIYILTLTFEKVLGMNVGRLWKRYKYFGSTHLYCVNPAYKWKSCLFELVISQNYA